MSITDHPDERERLLSAIAECRKFIECCVTPATSSRSCRTCGKQLEYIEEFEAAIKALDSDGINICHPTETWSDGSIVTAPFSGAYDDVPSPTAFFDTKPTAEDMGANADSRTPDLIHMLAKVDKAERALMRPAHGAEVSLSDARAATALRRCVSEATRNCAAAIDEALAMYAVAKK